MFSSGVVRKFFIPQLYTLEKNSTATLPWLCAIHMGLLSIYQHKQDAFGWICINSYPNVLHRHWGGCVAVPQRRWGPLRPHNTTGVFLSYKTVIQHFWCVTFGLGVWDYNSQLVLYWAPNPNPKPKRSKSLKYYEKRPCKLCEPINKRTGIMYSFFSFSSKNLLFSFVGLLEYEWG